MNVIKNFNIKLEDNQYQAWFSTLILNLAAFYTCFP